MDSAVVEIGGIYGPKYAIGFLKTLQYQQETAKNLKIHDLLGHWDSGFSVVPCRVVSSAYLFSMAMRIQFPFPPALENIRGSTVHFLKFESVSCWYWRVLGKPIARLGS